MTKKMIEYVEHIVAKDVDELEDQLLTQAMLNFLNGTPSESTTEGLKLLMTERERLLNGH